MVNENKTPNYIAKNVPYRTITYMYIYIAKTKSELERVRVSYERFVNICVYHKITFILWFLSL